MRILKGSITGVSLVSLLLLAACDNKGNPSASANIQSAQEAAAEVSKTIQTSQAGTPKGKSGQGTQALATAAAPEGGSKSPGRHGGQANQSSTGTGKQNPASKTVTDSGIVGLPDPGKMADTVQEAVTATKEAADKAADTVSDAGGKALEKTKSLFKEEEQKNKPSGFTSAQQAAASTSAVNSSKSPGNNQSPSMKESRQEDSGKQAQQTQAAGSGEIAGLPKGATETIKSAASATKEAAGSTADKLAAAGESIVDKAKSALTDEDKKMSNEQKAKKCYPKQGANASTDKSSESGSGAMPVQSGEKSKPNDGMKTGKTPEQGSSNMASQQAQPANLDSNQKPTVSGGEIAGIPHIGTDTVKNAVETAKEAAEGAVTKLAEKIK